MKILILTTAYPTEQNVYSNAFVHSRVVEYKKRYDVSVDVCVCRRNQTENSYYYDGVYVRELSEEKLKCLLKKNNYDKILVHFLTVPIMNSLRSVEEKNSIIVWVHGEEALSWKTRLFNLKQPYFLKYVISNIIQLKEYKKFVRSFKDVKYVFVSKWMKKQAEIDIGINFENYEIVPNGIDIHFFNLQKKDFKKIRVLLIRPFTSKKYATDIAIEAIEKFSSYSEFYNFEFSIYGSGPLLDRQTKNIKKFKNVKIYDRFLNRNEIKIAHDNHQIFLCPTRQDAQGVSMCEAMASGLIPITSNSTAIPEFVDHNSSGFLTESSNEIVEVLFKLNDNKDLISKMSIQARNRVVKQCDLEKIMNKETKMIFK